MGDLPVTHDAGQMAAALQAMLGSKGHSFQRQQLPGSSSAAGARPPMHPGPGAGVTACLNYLGAVAEWEAATATLVVVGGGQAAAGDVGVAAAAVAPGAAGGGPGGEVRALQELAARAHAMEAAVHPK